MIIFENKRYRKPNGQSRMDIQETPVTLGTQMRHKYIKFTIMTSHSLNKAADPSSSYM